MSTSFSPTFIRTDRATEKLLTQEANGLSLDLEFIVVSDSKFDPDSSMTEIPNGLDPVRLGGTDTNVALKQKTLKFALPVGMGDLRINAVGILDSDGELAYVWSSTDPQQQLGYKEIGTRYLQGIVLRIFDAPFDSVQVVHDNTLADVDLSFVELEMQQTKTLLTTMLAVGEMCASLRQAEQERRAMRSQIAAETERASLAEQTLQNQQSQDNSAVQQHLNRLQQWQDNTAAFLATQLNFNAATHAGIGSFGVALQQ